MRSTAVAVALLALSSGACEPEDYAPRARRDGAVADSAASDDPSPCAAGEFYIGRVVGRAVRVRGAFTQPVANAQLTVCGSACVPGEADAQGRFAFDVEQCFPSQSAYPHGAVVQLVGSPEQLDMYLDPFESTGRRSFTVLDLGDFYAPSLAGASSARIDASSSTTVTLTSAAGAVVRFAPRAIELPFSAQDMTVQLVDVSRESGEALQTPGLDDRAVSFVAIAPADTKLFAPAQVELVNALALPAGSSVELVALGNHGTEELVAPGVLGVVGYGVVSADGRRITGETRAFGLLGYRLARGQRPPLASLDAGVTVDAGAVMDAAAPPPATPPATRTDRCRFFARACLACTAVPECGYARETGECFPGSESGPDPRVAGASMVSWVWFQDECNSVAPTPTPPPSSDPCSTASDCASCTARDQCGWCAGRCLTGTSRGPITGTCASWQWVSSDCSAAPPPPPPPPPPADSGVATPDASTPPRTDAGTCAPPSSNFCGRPTTCNLRPFSLTDANTNAPWALYGADYCSARATVIVVSAGWCGACQREAPEFESRIQRGYGPRGVRSVITLIENADRSRATTDFALSWQRRFSVTSRMTIDPTRQVSSALGLSSISLPHTLVIDRTGRIRHSGFAEVSTIAALLDRILAE